MNHGKIMSRQVFFNGDYVPEDEAKISIYDSALMFGDMAFEMTRSFNKLQFKLDEHIERLYAGLKILEINIPYSQHDLKQICLEVQKINDPYFSDDDEHRLMINVSRGPLGIYSGNVSGLKQESTVIVADFPLKWTLRGMDKLLEKGINMHIPPQRSIPACLMDPKIKNRSRLWYQMANIQISKLSGERNWALLEDTDGFITEGTGCNFFIVKDGKIISPEGRNILRGTRRKYIFELAEEIGIDCIEKNIEQYDVYNADEAFVTATPFCILPVVSFQGSSISDAPQNSKTCLGKITKLLIDRWSKNVGVDIVEQIFNFNQRLEIADSSAPTTYKFK